MKKFILLFLLSVSSLFAVDRDNDLVPDNIDKCLDTPAGVFVDMNGCTKKIKRVIHFGYNSSMIDKNMMQKLQQYSQLAKEAFGYNIILKGDTDSVADYKTNLMLSKKRVYAVLKSLEDLGIKRDRISVKWYGESMPIATNITSKGRAINRRVEIILQ